jgi:hypothetical protein
VLATLLMGIIPGMLRASVLESVLDLDTGTAACTWALVIPTILTILLIGEAAIRTTPMVDIAATEEDTIPEADIAADTIIHIRSLMVPVILPTQHATTMRTATGPPETLLQVKRRPLPLLR